MPLDATLLNSFQSDAVRGGTAGKVLHHRITGLLTSEWIARLVEYLRSHTAPYAHFTSVHVSGIDDAPVSWGTSQHYYGVGGDHHFTVTMSGASNEAFLLSVSCCPTDAFQ